MTSTIGHDHHSLREKVLDELRRLILSGELEPGARLKEQEVAERLGVSRLPIREAFRGLEAEGLLRSMPRRGVVVTEPSREEIEVVQAVRMSLELLAVQLAATRQDPETMEALRQSLATGRAAAKEKDADTLSKLNAEFHDLLGQGSGSDYLADLLRSVRNQAHYLVGGMHAAPKYSWREHARIVKAVLNGQGETAAALMRDHLEARHELSAKMAATTE